MTTGPSLETTFRCAQVYPSSLLGAESLCKIASWHLGFGRNHLRNGNVLIPCLNTYLTKIVHVNSHTSLTLIFFIADEERGAKCTQSIRILSRCSCKTYKNGIFCTKYLFLSIFLFETFIFQPAFEEIHSFSNFIICMLLLFEFNSNCNSSTNFSKIPQYQI
jgi:hypothetical protein